MVGTFILACIAVFAVLGFFQGLMRQIIGIAALVMAYVLAEPAGALIPDSLVQSANVPLALAPGVKMGLGGLIVLIVGMFVGRVGVKLFGMVKRKEAAAKQRKRDRARGALFGALKGVIFALIVLWIVFSLGQVAEVVEEPRAQAAAAPPAAEVLPGEAPKTEPAEKMSGSSLRSFFANAKKQIAQSVAGPLMRRANVLDAELLESLGDVIDISNDPMALARLRAHPDIKKLMASQKIRDLTDDPDIIEAGKGQRLLDLLNNPKVARVANDPKLKAALRAIDFDNVIAHAKGEVEGSEGE